MTYFLFALNKFTSFSKEKSRKFLRRIIFLGFEQFYIIIIVFISKKFILSLKIF